MEPSTLALASFASRTDKSKQNKRFEDAMLECQECGLNTPLSLLLSQLSYPGHARDN